MERLVMKNIFVFVTVVSLLGSGCDLPTRVGSVCQLDQHCGGKEGELQLVCDHQLPGGLCTVEGCTPDNPDTLDVAEDAASCPPGTRCVLEKSPLMHRCKTSGEVRAVCRPQCTHRGECPEVMFCGTRCFEQNGEEVCVEECPNRMECVPFWTHLPDPNASEEAKKQAENPPRACVLYGSECVATETSGE